MVQFRKRYLIIAYIISLSMVYLFATNSQVSAFEKPVEVKPEQEIIYTIEKNDVDSLNQVKKAILKNDPKYVLEPKALKEDLEQSEIVLNSFDADTNEAQRIEATVIRYREAEGQKIKVDELQGDAMIKFADTQAPNIVLKKKTMSVKYGASLNLKKQIKEVTDNVDGHVPVTIDHKINTKKPGKYKVTFTAVDKAGNQSQETMTVTVRKKPKKKVKKPKVEAVAERVSQPQVAASNNTASNTVVKPSIPYQPIVNAGSLGSMLNTINAQRAQRGIAPLSLASGAHNTAAAVRAAEASTFFSHTRPNGTSYHTAFTEQGVSANGGVEILAYHSTGNHQLVVNQWLNSPVHARNMLSPNFSVVALGSSGGTWAAILM